MIGIVDRKVKLTIVYAPNDRQDEAHSLVELARGEQARFCNPKYWENSGIEQDAIRVVILPFSPHLDAILAAYQEAGIPASVAGGAAPSAPPPPASGGLLSPPPHSPPVGAPTPVAELPPWTSKRFPTPESYCELYPNAQTPTAELARQHVAARRLEG